jgi:hypothetical protein
MKTIKWDDKYGGTSTRVGRWLVEVAFKEGKYRLWCNELGIEKRPLVAESLIDAKPEAITIVLRRLKTMVAEIESALKGSASDE